MFQDPTCLFFDFNNVLFTCWFHYEAKNAYDSDIVTQYHKRPCTTSPPTSEECGIEYRITEGVSAADGTPLPTATTLAECQAICTSVSRSRPNDNRGFWKAFC